MRNRLITTPVVIALAGLPGAGKSTLARRLRERYPLSLIDRDALRANMFPDCRYTEAEKRAAERAVKNMVAGNCAAGRNNLIDGMTFARRSVRDEFSAHAGACGAQFVVLWLDCPASVARERVAFDNAHVAADRVPGLIDRVVERFEAPGPGAWRIDGMLPPGDVFRQACKLLTTELQLEDRQ